MSPRRRTNQDTSSTSNRLRLDSLNKILKLDSSKSKKRKKETITKQVSRIALTELLKNTPARSQDLPDFKTFLSDKENIKVFRDFLKTQYCQENIDFYLACEKYRNLDREKVGRELIKFMATQIYNDFLGESAKHPININYACLQNITKDIKNPDQNLLCEAQTEIFNLMRTDCYPRFCKTWQLDRETANKILTERHINSTPMNRTDTTISSSYKDNSTISLSLSQPRGVKRKLISSSTSECPPECPYFRVGLPCQQHNLGQNELFEQRGKSDLIDRINLSKIHRVPKCCEPKRSPPPPPLPPKPFSLPPLKPLPPTPTTQNVEVSLTINKRYCAYVGKVFDV